MPDLVKSVSIDSLLQQRDTIVSRLEEAFRLLNEADAIAKSGLIGSVWDAIDAHTNIHIGSRRLSRPEAKDLIIKRLDAGAWHALMRESGLQSFMDSKARAEWAENIQRLEVPPLTRGTIEATFENLYSARSEFFERGVLELYRRLSWEYKTNSPRAFGKRVIIHRLLSSWGHLEYRTASELDDLMRVFHLMDGKPELDHRNGMYYQLNNAGCGMPTGRVRGEYENDYLHLRWFKKGTAHLTFRRPDLVDELNRIVAKHYPNTLPAAA